MLLVGLDPGHPPGTLDSLQLRERSVLVSEDLCVTVLLAATLLSEARYSHSSVTASSVPCCRQRCKRPAVPDEKNLLGEAAAAHFEQKLT